MVVVSTRDFRVNQTKYLNMAKSGEHVVLKSRAGSFRISPEDTKDVKEAIEGKRILLSAESLADEL